MKTFNDVYLRLLLTLVASCSYISSSSADSAINEIVISADFRDVKLLESAVSVTVLDSQAIAKRQARHLEQLLNLAPNVNFSSGASRGRFIQIRGIGERSQFIEPLNPSVGILIDGIDFTGIAGAATTMDIQQVEILRGPQGTLHGANALAGLINLQAVQPSNETMGNVMVSLADYDSQTLSAGVGGPVNEKLAYRLAVQKNTTDGYVQNDFLNRSDTDNIDELSLRSIVDWQANADTSLKLTVFHVDADNGYDAFSLDNTRSTLSDNPGHDRHKATGISLLGNWDGNKNFDIEAVLSYGENNLEYGYDEDWTYADVCEDYECIYDGYASTDNYIRESKNTSSDIRVLSKAGQRIFSDTTDWVIGWYWRDQDEQLLRHWTYATNVFTSDYKTKNQAIYGQTDSHLADDLTLIVGVRLENRQASYRDSELVAHTVDENLWGGRVALQYKLADNAMIYGLASRGYKAGGVNSDPSLTADDRQFDTEKMWNIEAGIKGTWLEGTIQAQIASFYQLRDDIQIKQSLVQSIEDSEATSFTDYFGNAAQGKNYGIEAEFNWLLSDAVTFFGTLGWLKTEYDIPMSDALDRREQAHAPSYQFSVGSSVRVSNDLSFTVDIEGKDEFFLSSRHSSRTRSYELFNASIDYNRNHWTLSFWGRNLTDKDVVVRGFGSFGNDPRKGYVTEPYYQFGAPRVLGVTVKYEF
ncbi:MAG: TonB-dependent receptor [Porticoccaceae bacterium]